MNNPTVKNVVPSGKIGKTQNSTKYFYPEIYFTLCIFCHIFVRLEIVKIKINFFFRYL